MCGSATLTMVVSSTTISWAVRITKRRHSGWLRRLPERCPTWRSGARRSAAAPRARTQRGERALTSTFPLVVWSKRKLPPVIIRRVPPFSNPVNYGSRSRRHGVEAGSRDRQRSETRSRPRPVRRGPAHAGRRPAQPRAPGRRRPRGLRRAGRGRLDGGRSPGRPVWAWGPCTATSPSASTSSRPSTGRRRRTRPGGRTGPWPTSSRGRRSRPSSRRSCVTPRPSRRC